MKTIVITGCLGGIGKATSIRLLKQGYNVIGLDVKDTCDIDNLDYYKVDIRNEESILNAFNEIKTKIDNVFAIIHLSGIYVMDSLLEISEEELKRVLDINFLGMTRVNRIFFPLLSKGSKILITSSELAPLDPLPFNGLYGMTKTLVEKYAFSLRMEVNNFGIDVIVLRPGAIETPLIDDSLSSLDKLCNKTIIHKQSAFKFKKIVDSVEAKAIKPEILAKYISKIISKKHPKYVYKKNANFLLKLLNALPDRMQVKIISKLLK